MAKFLPDGSLYIFIGIITSLFTMMIGCFLYHKGKTYFQKPFFRSKARKAERNTVKQRTRRNKFLMKKGERADADEEGGAESHADKVRADIDAKYNTQVVWSTIIPEGDLDPPPAPEEGN